MLQKIKNRLPLGKLQLDPRLTLLGLAGAAALLAVGSTWYLWRDQGAFHALYGAGEAFPAAEVMQVLDGEGIVYRLHPQSGQVLVRDDQLARARMLLAAKGVKVSVPPGYELFDKDEPLGASQFVQDVRLKRSLEGELARTVMTMEGVQQARVHLALDQASSFVVSQREPAKASVMLQLAPGYRLKPEQVAAILNLVANSVPQLQADAVSVVDQHGVLLSRGLSAWGGSQQNWQLVDEVQQKAVANIEQVLAPIVGPGNYRVSVASDIDFSQTEETRQSYGDTPRLRRETLRDDSTLDELALGVPGSLSNRPPVKPQDSQTPPAPGAPGANPGNQANATGAAQDQKNKAATSLRKESNRQLDYDQNITHVKHAPFNLRQQSVAVMINAAAAPQGGWSEDARKQMEAAVKNAVGFNAERGDSLALSVLPFVVGAPLDERAPWWDDARLQDLAKLGVFGLISVLLLLIVVRPAVRSLSNRPAPQAQGDEQNLALLAGEQGERLLARIGGESRALGVFSELNPLSEIRLPAPGSGLEHQIEHLQMLAKNDPERVSEVIKQWIGRNERDLNPAG
ncbi:flagellar basal-body MS-ring/collar protein FliF [Pseudomonas panipatensis]|uniref:Flagellar M-ring protein n=1 Tax=Pseudomonas panipatensis TaxID=428992 RepID=A0A1G8FPP6_9PSED|nr:flagellar basal-body MS-ring/collar protein FliF [Pseudomonas panipatensis]SDH84111.1 flagellar M-ring protein FliF [Pseudomonas panipatensis]SMP52719.1 flagellar M-ring protein FliF [Pseudomonas panipatensis]